MKLARRGGGRLIVLYRQLSIGIGRLIVPYRRGVEAERALVHGDCLFRAWMDWDSNTGP